MLDFALYVLHLAVVTTLIAFAVSLYLDGLGYIVFHILALAGVSAFTFAVLSVSFSWEPALAALVGVGAATIAGGLCAEAIQSLRGDGLSLVTFGFGVAAFEVFRYLELTGSVYGIGGIPSIMGKTTSLIEASVALLLLLFVTLLMRGWRKSLGGVIVMALRMDEGGALSVGARLSAHQRLTGIFAGGLAGLGGVYLASITRYIEPRDFQVSGILVPLAAAILAGGRTPIGVFLIGTAIVLFSQGARFIGGSPVLVGPVTEIVISMLVGVLLVVLRLREDRRERAHG